MFCVEYMYKQQQSKSTLTLKAQIFQENKADISCELTVQFTWYISLTLLYC